MQVDSQQRDADQCHMDPPLFHLELSGVGVSFLPVTDTMDGDAFRGRCEANARPSADGVSLQHKMINPVHPCCVHCQHRALKIRPLTDDFGQTRGETAVS